MVRQLSTWPVSARLGAFEHAVEGDLLPLWRAQAGYDGRKPLLLARMPATQPTILDLGPWHE